jgi:hypothetical protein
MVLSDFQLATEWCWKGALVLPLWLDVAALRAEDLPVGVVLY